MPRVTNPGGEASQYWNRNPLAAHGIFSSNAVAPHSIAERSLYTVPADRKAMVELCHLQAVRISAAGTPLEVRISLGHTPSGGSLQHVFSAQLQASDNTAGDKAEVYAGFQFLAEAGDTVTVNTLDNSTTGTVAYLGQFKVTEFDA